MLGCRGRAAGGLRNALALVDKPPGAGAAALCGRLQAATALEARCPGDTPSAASQCRNPVLNM